MHPGSNYLLMYVPIFTLLYVTHAVHCNCAPYMNELGDIYMHHLLTKMRKNILILIKKKL